jgi:hypothetical protein
MDNIEENIREDEVRLQLAAMLSKPRFRNATNQGDVLKFMVEAALKGKMIVEDDIGYALFPKYRSYESTDVRVTISSLRKSLQKYYEEEGVQEWIKITLPAPSKDKSLKLPPGEAYRPIISQNPRHPASVQFRIGETLSRRGDGFDLEPAIAAYTRTLELQPDFAEAVIGMGRVCCDLYLHVSEERRPDLKATIETLLHRAHSLAPELWRTFLLWALYYQRFGDTTAEDEAFRRALECNPAGVKEHYQYHNYLLRNGKVDEALEFAKSHADKHPDDPDLVAHYGQYLLLAKHIEQAVKTLQYALVLDRSCFVANAYLAGYYVHLDQPEKAQIYKDRLRANLHPYTYQRLCDQLELQAP